MGRVGRVGGEGRLGDGDLAPRRLVLGCLDRLNFLERHGDAVLLVCGLGLQLGQPRRLKRIKGRRWGFAQTDQLFCCVLFFVSVLWCVDSHFEFTFTHARTLTTTSNNTRYTLKAR